VAQPTKPTVAFEAIVSAAPVIGHLRLNIIKGKKYRDEAWVVAALVEGKMAIRLPG
jgi:hypothetical protein